ncbi:MAG TPA: ABC transporter permease [Thermotogota bacterium]|nr:MAG: Glutathione transport system permease protein GsiD [Thermotogota bacterium ADurb.Bin062]HOD92073.1 ABC transporter permease [Thermotogota bacterium]
MKKSEKKRTEAFDSSEELRRTFRKIRRHHGFIVGFLLLFSLCLLTATSLLFTPHDPYKMNPKASFQPPSWNHPFGTDDFGRDTFSRCMVGSQTALLVGLVSTSISLGFGLLLGLLAGLSSKWVDEIIMRLMDGLYAFPAILFAIALISVLGSDVKNATIAIGIARIPIFAREVRNSVRQVRIKNFAVAARAMGVSYPRQILFYYLPSILAPLTVLTSSSFAYTILSESGLSYLGLGSQPPFPSWGRLLMESQRFLTRAPWLSVFPGIMIAWAVLAFTLLGDGLRDIADPKI